MGIKDYFIEVSEELEKIDETLYNLPYENDHFQFVTEAHFLGESPYYCAKQLRQLAQG